MIMLMMNEFNIEYAEEMSMIMISTTTKQSTCDTKENKKKYCKELNYDIFLPNVTPCTSNLRNFKSSC